MMHRFRIRKLFKKVTIFGNYSKEIVVITKYINTPENAVFLKIQILINFKSS
jgi:hypothetical protein